MVWRQEMLKPPPNYQPDTCKYDELNQMMSRFLYMARHCCDHPEPCVASDLEDVLGAYVLQKPLTLLDFPDISTALFFTMVSKLSHYFFLAYTEPEQTKPGYIRVELYISRFKTLVNVASDPGNEDQADLRGILVGYSPQDVAQFCSLHAPQLVK